jgi:hypothetical protein
MQNPKISTSPIPQKTQCYLPPPPSLTAVSAHKLYPCQPARHRNTCETNTTDQITEFLWIQGLAVIFAFKEISQQLLWKPVSFIDFSSAILRPFSPTQNRQFADKDGGFRLRHIKRPKCDKNVPSVRCVIKIYRACKVSQKCTERMMCDKNLRSVRGVTKMYRAYEVW